MLRLIAVLLGIAGWTIVAIIYSWVEWNGGQALVHTRAFPPYERVADLAAIGLAFAVLSWALWRELSPWFRD